MKLHDPSNSRPQSVNGCAHNFFPLPHVVSLFRIGSTVWSFVLRPELSRRVGLVHRNFSYSALLAKLPECRIDRNARQPSCKLRSSVEVLEMDESRQESILHCVFCVFAISRNSVGNAEEFSRMACAKFSERSLVSSPG